MKARAGLLMLFMMVIGFTGFGFATSDLNQNSETIAIVTDEVTVDLASVESLFLHEYVLNDRYSKTNTSVEQVENISAYALNFKNIASVNPTSYLRSPRDGLSCDNDKFSIE